MDENCENSGKLILFKNKTPLNDKALKKISSQ